MEVTLDSGVANGMALSKKTNTSVTFAVVSGCAVKLQGDAQLDFITDEQ